MDKIYFNNVVEAFKTVKDRDGNHLNMHDFMVYQENGEMFEHQFRETTKKSDTRSISKTVMTFLTGIVIEKSRQGEYAHFDEETYVLPILLPYIEIHNLENIAYLEKVKIKHLLTHTIGFDDILMMRQDLEGIDPKDYLNKTLNHPIKHEPGTYYLYSNAGFFTLSAVLEHFLGEPLLEFAKREFFERLEIVDYEWEKYGPYCAGATRLWMHPHDLLKLGRLFLDGGNYGGTCVVRPEWLELMHTFSNFTVIEDTPNAAFRRYAYGYGMWLGHRDYYFGYGTDGQTLIILPHQKVVILTFAHHVDVKPIEKILSEVLMSFGITE